jgi:hypothetical protein
MQQRASIADSHKAVSCEHDRIQVRSDSGQDCLPVRTVCADEHSASRPNGHEAAAPSRQPKYAIKHAGRRTPPLKQVGGKVRQAVRVHCCKYASIVSNAR